MADMTAIDWDLAARAGATAAPKGPSTRARERREVVAELRRLSDEAHGHAVRVTHLPDPGAPIQTEVVGRGRWVELTVGTAKLLLRRVGQEQDPSSWSLAQAVAARAVGVQVGAVLGWLSGKIVGQFDPYGERPSMIMVAPNVLQIERDLKVDPRDFRLWVLVHEQTHRLQFHAAPWLREHLMATISEMIEDGLAHPAPGAGAARSTRPTSLVDLVSGPEQRARIDHVTAIMSVLEGYAEVMMDSVGPDVIPTVADIRRRFQKRREKGGLDAILRRLLGMDTKMAQYRDGAAFCRAVIDSVGVEGLNRVFESPEAMPSYDELMDPPRWVRRVIG